MGSTIARPGLNNSFLNEMVALKDARSLRASSWDRTGRNQDWVSVNAGETITLAEFTGGGCVRHTYFTIGGVERFFLRNLILRCYWDGEDTPSVEVPIADFFGIGFCEEVYYTSLLTAVNYGIKTGSTIGLAAYFPMPFAKGARITLHNDSPVPVTHVWYHFDCEAYDAPDPDDTGSRFHAQFRRENPCVAVKLPDGVNLDGKENYVILEAKGQGNYVGMFLNVDNICGGWYGEGDDMIFIDDDTWPPSFHGTGTEEIFGGGACPNGVYAGTYTGFHLISNDDWAGKQSMYRFHVTDPVRFKKSIRVTLEHGHANDLGNDYSSTAFWYQAEPHAAFPTLPDFEGRRPRMKEGAEAAYKKAIETLAVLSTFGSPMAFFEKLSQDEQKAMFENLGGLNKNIKEDRPEEAMKNAEAIGAVLAKYRK